MEGLEYVVVEPACEVNEKGTREKNDGNENLSLDDNEKIEVDSEAGSFIAKIGTTRSKMRCPSGWSQIDQYHREPGLAIVNGQA